MSHVSRTIQRSTGIPSWSPDGNRITFQSNRDGNSEIYVMSAEGSNETRITTTPSEAEVHPVWSPDGTRIAFQVACGFNCRNRIHAMNPDGSDRALLTLPDRLFENVGFDWQPLPVNTPSTHARPLSAKRVQFPLVQAFIPCTTPNREHGPPLDSGSCSPAVPTSSHLTAGGGSRDPSPPRSTGVLAFRVQVGAPGGADDTDVTLRLELTNIMRVSDFAEYTGEVRAGAMVRVTDREGTVPPGTVSSTIRDFPIAFDATCVPTPAAPDGSTCSTNTTLDALIPGSTPERAHAVWSIDQVEVHDGGQDGNADTEEDNRLFAVPGIFVP